MKRILTLSILSLVIFSACSKDDNDLSDANGAATITFDATVANADFALNKDFIISGNTYNFKQLRYWVSNVSLVNQSGAAYKVPSSYYLLEETNAVLVQDGKFEYPASKREAVTIQNIPAGKYAAIRFSLGVDSIHNSNMSLQAGELSQLNGMTNISWMWHTSYIFTSLTGSFTASGITQQIKVETGLNENYKAIEISLPAPLEINAGKAAEVKLNVDLAKILQGLNLATTPVIGAAQKAEMTTVTANYQQAISLK